MKRLTTIVALKCKSKPNSYRLPPNNMHISNDTSKSSFKPITAVADSVSVSDSDSVLIINAVEADVVNILSLPLLSTQMI